MLQTGIIRRVDELGRIVIPKSVREMASIGIDDALEIGVERSSDYHSAPTFDIILRKYISEDKRETSQGVEYAPHWIRVKQKGCRSDDFICSECGNMRMYVTKYCPNCGAKMGGPYVEKSGTRNT